MKKYVFFLALIFATVLFTPNNIFAQQGEPTAIEAIVADNDSTHVKNDKINLPFRSTYKRDIAGAVSNLNASEINEIDNTIWVSDALAGRTLGMLGNTSIRGIGIGIDVADITGSGLLWGNALVIVDGLPRDISSLRLSEVESITVLKDVNSAILYGSAAVNGVIVITTKRGKAFKNRSNFTGNYGIFSPREMPKYLNSSDYMTYFNKARENDGLTPLFSDETIENHRTGSKYRYPDIDYYSDEYLKSYRTYFDLNGEISGGVQDVQYYTNLGWHSEDGILNFGEGRNERSNLFNIRTNIDFRINKWIKAAIDGTAVFGNHKGPRGNYWGDASIIRPHEYTPLLPISLISPDNPLWLARKNDIDGKYLLGGNTKYTTTPIGDIYSGGVNESVQRNFSFNNQLDFDLNKLTQGLSFHTNISFEYFVQYYQTIANQYSVYEPTWDVDNNIVSLKQHGKDSRPGTQSVGSTYFRRRFGFYGQLNYDRAFDGVHHITGSLLGYGNNFTESGDIQGAKQAHLGLQLAYVFDKRYVIDFSSAVVNSVKLPEGNRIGFSPSLGLGWVITGESFMSAAKNVDYLKLRLSGGILNSDMPIAGFFYYDNYFTTSASYNWYENTRGRNSVVSAWGSNPNLGFAKKNEVNLGIEGLFFKKLLNVEANVFYDSYNDLVTRPQSSYPGFYTDFIAYRNFGSDRYVGGELGLNLNKSFGDWSLFFGVNALYVSSKRTKVDEIYNNDYQYRKGHPRDAIFGLEALGLFEDQDDIDSSPFQTFRTVMPGDIKYKDQNNDGVIDTNDEVYLGRSRAPFSGGLQLKIAYKSLSLYILGEGRSGSRAYMSGDYYWVDGNKKYSEVVLNSWTPETKNTATYPRLSSQTSSNNFRGSSYWLYNNDYFQIRKIQLTYHMPESITDHLRMTNFDIFMNTSDVFLFAKQRKIMETRAGAQPLYRTFSIGLKTNF